MPSAGSIAVAVTFHAPDRPASVSTSLWRNSTPVEVLTMALNTFNTVSVLSSKLAKTSTTA